MRDITTLYQPVRNKALQLQKEASTRLGLTVIITECLRTNDEQRALYSQGRDTLAQTNALRHAVGWAPITQRQASFTVTNAKTAADSFHGYGLAFDVAVVDATGKKIDWSSNSDQNDNDVNDWYEVGQLGLELGLEWGGNWTSRPDMPHFQMTFGETIKSLKSNGYEPGKTYWPKTVSTKPEIVDAAPVFTQEFNAEATPDQDAP